MSKEILQVLQGSGPSTTEMYRFDGSSWVNTTQDLNSPGGLSGSELTLFSFRGSAYAAYTDLSANTVAIARWTGSAWAFVTNASALGLNNYLMTNVVMWRGKARWLMLARNGVSPAAYAMSFDGSSIAVVDVAGVFGGVSLVPGGIDGTFDSTAGGTRAALLLHDDRLVLYLAGGGVTGGSSQPSAFGYQSFYYVDLTDAGAQSSEFKLDPTISGWEDSTASRWFMTHSRDSSGDHAKLDKWLVKGGLLSMFSFKGKLYIVGVTGEVREVINGVVQPTVLFDLRDLGASYTVTARNPANQNLFTTGQNTHSFGVNGTASNLPSWAAFAIGSKVSGAIAGTISSSIAWNDGASSDGYFRVIDGNGNRVAPITAGSVTVKRARVTAHPQIVNGTFTYYTTLAPLAPTFHERNGVGYLVVPGRWARTTDGQDALESWVIKWNGTGTVFGAYGTTGLQAFEILRAGAAKPNFTGMCSYLDPEDGVIHIRGVDALAQVAFHIVYSTASDTHVDVGTVSAFPSTAYRRGQMSQNFLGWNLNEGGVTITGITKDALHTQATIAYTLYSADSHALDIALEYDKGDGFTPVVTGTGTLTGKASAPGGTAHTYVHDLATDIPGFVGNVVYRIRVL